MEVNVKKILSLVAVFGLVFASAEVFAAGNTGCGLGAVLLKGKKGKFFELAASCLNATSMNQTFAITSGTSGYEEGAVIGMTDVEVFVAKNMDSLATDIARGNGEYVDTLASMYKVQDVDGFKTKLKNNFDKIYTNTGVTSKEVVANINDVVNG